MKLDDLLHDAVRGLPPLRALPDGTAARVHRRRRRRQGLVGASSALGVGVLVAGALVLLPGHSDTVTAADEPRRDPGVQLCLPHPVSRPTLLAVRCTPGSPVLRGLTWQSYTPATATATGAYVDAGVSTPVSVRLSGQATQDGEPVYTFLELEFAGAPPAGSPAEEPLLGVRPGDDTGGKADGELPGVRGEDPSTVSVRPDDVCLACFPDAPTSDVRLEHVEWSAWTTSYAVGVGSVPCASSVPHCHRAVNGVFLTAPVVHDGALQFASARFGCTGWMKCAPGDQSRQRSPDEFYALVLGPSSP